MKTLCVDFDGVLHLYTSGWKGVGEVPDGPVPGAIDWLCRMSKLYDICVYSSRSKDPRGVTAMVNALRVWAQDAGMQLQDIDSLIGRLKFPTEKPAAYLTIDDRAICFDGTWPTTDQIDSFVPWNKKPKHEPYDYQTK